MAPWSRVQQAKHVLALCKARTPWGATLAARVRANMQHALQGVARLGPTTQEPAFAAPTWHVSATSRRLPYLPPSHICCTALATSAASSSSCGRGAQVPEVSLSGELAARAATGGAHPSSA